MARFVPILTSSAMPDLEPAHARLRGRRAASASPAPARRNPVGKKARGKRGGWVAKSGQGKFEHVRVRPPGHFVSGSLKTVPWAFVSDARERAFVLKQLRRTSLPAGAKVITGRIKSTVKTGRIPGTRVKYLATGVQAVLLPGGAKATKAARPKRVTRAPAPRKTAARVRANPGRLVILNPANLPAGPVAETAKSIRKPAERALFIRTYQQASSAERAELVQSLRTYHGFHHVWPPSFTTVGKTEGTHHKFFVGLGQADHVGYRAGKAFPGSSKQGAPWRHHFSSGQLLVTNANGKGGLGILDRPGARRGTEVTDFIRR